MICHDIVLVVDDDSSIRTMIRDFLNNEGFKTLGSSSGNEALSVFHEESPCMILLDLMLPDIDGLEILKILRDFSTTPVIALSARRETYTKIQCLNLGADDYLTKPFNLDELLARIQAILRRTQNLQRSLSSFFNDDLIINFEKRQVMVAGQEILLSPLEYKLLTELAIHAGKTLNHKYLLQNVWGNTYGNEKEYLHVYIGQLRSKIEVNPKNPQYIITVPRVGYRFNTGKDLAHSEKN